MTLAWVGVAIVLVGAAFYFIQTRNNDDIPAVKNQHMERQEAPKDSLPQAYMDKTPIYQEFSAGDKYTSPNGMMVFEDGQILRYADVVVTVENGEAKMEKAALKWRKEAKITDNGIKEIKTLIQNFKAKKHKNLDPKSVVHVEYNSGNTAGEVSISGKKTPENYAFFTAVNRAISLNTVNKVD